MSGLLIDKYMKKSTSNRLTISDVGWVDPREFRLRDSRPIRRKPPVKKPMGWNLFRSGKESWPEWRTRVAHPESFTRNFTRRRDLTPGQRETLNKALDEFSAIEAQQRIHESDSGRLLSTTNSTQNSKRDNKMSKSRYRFWLRHASHLESGTKHGSKFGVKVRPKRVFRDVTWRLPW